MTRAITGALGPHLASRESFPVDCVMIERLDGVRAGHATLDGGFDFNLGGGVESYAPDMALSSLTLAAGIDASSAEFEGALGGTVTREAVLGGAWDDAEAWLFRASPIAAGIAPLLHGRIREARVEGERWIFQLRGEADRFNIVQCRLLTPYCKADLGDALCGVANTPVAATVTAVAGDMAFTVNAPGGPFADGWFTLGTAQFLTGDLAGGAPVDIFAWDDSGALTVFTPLPEPPQVGDTLELKRGCPKTREACRDLFGNAVRFRGFPEVPGSDQVLKYQVPGDAGA